MSVVKLKCEVSAVDHLKKSKRRVSPGRETSAARAASVVRTFDAVDAQHSCYARPMGREARYAR